MLVNGAWEVLTEARRRRIFLTPSKTLNVKEKGLCENVSGPEEINIFGYIWLYFLQVRRDWSVYVCVCVGGVIISLIGYLNISSQL